MIFLSINQIRVFLLSMTMASSKMDDRYVSSVIIGYFRCLAKVSTQEVGIRPGLQGQASIQHLYDTFPCYIRWRQGVYYICYVLEVRSSSNSNFAMETFAKQRKYPITGTTYLSSIDARSHCHRKRKTRI